MPQGGAGKCGGNLMSSGNSKKKMSAKPHILTSKVRLPRGGPVVASEEAVPAHTVIRPNKETRALVMRAHQAMMEVRRKEMLAARRGKKLGAPLGGQSLGGNDMREARLKYLERQHGATVVTTPAVTVNTATVPTSTAAAAAAQGRARRDAYEAEHAADDIVEEVFASLDLLAKRLTSRAAVEQAHSTLCTVLRNASVNAGPDADPKYRVLRSHNAKLWARLLCHMEALHVLDTAGFEKQKPSDTRAVSGGCEHVLSGSTRVPAFIETAFPTKVEYERWVKVEYERLVSSEGDGCAAEGDESAAGAEGDAATKLQSEIDEAQLALAQVLDSATAPDIGVVELLLTRLQELQLLSAPGASTHVLPSTPSLHAVTWGDTAQEGEFELVHPGSASDASVERLNAVLKAVMSWYDVSVDDLA